MSKWTYILLVVGVIGLTAYFTDIKAEDAIEAGWTEYRQTFENHRYSIGNPLIPPLSPIQKGVHKRVWRIGLGLMAGEALMGVGIYSVLSRRGVIT